MARLKKIFGYSIAWLGVPLVMATFIGMNFWAGQLVSATGVKVSPWFVGGEVVHIIAHDHYQTQLHRPVFDGLLWDSKEGFVQVDWRPFNALPRRIEEDIDYDQDGRNDFRVTIDVPSLQAQIQPLSPTVLGLEGVFHLEDSVAARVRLQKQRG